MCRNSYAKNNNNWILSPNNFPALVHTSNHVWQNRKVHFIFLHIFHQIISNFCCKLWIWRCNSSSGYCNLGFSTDTNVVNKHRLPFYGGTFDHFCQIELFSNVWNFLLILLYNVHTKRIFVCHIKGNINEWVISYSMWFFENLCPDTFSF